MARLYDAAVHRHHHPSRQVIDGDFADGAGGFHRQGAAGGVRVNDQTIGCRDAIHRVSALRPSARQVPLPNFGQIRHPVAIIWFTSLNFGNEISATRCIKAIGQNNFFTSGQMYGCTIVNNEIIIM